MERRCHLPDLAAPRNVEALAGYGVLEAEIAGVVGIDAKTLRKHYRQGLDHLERLHVAVKRWKTARWGRPRGRRIIRGGPGIANRVLSLVSTNVRLR